VANTVQWAANISGSYAGLGGAVKAGASQQGTTSTAVADVSQYTMEYQEASVSVATEVLGGTLAPQDVWRQSLLYDSTWAAIKREDPLPLWEIIGQDPENQELASQFEEVWVRKVFCGTGLRTVGPEAYDFIRKNPGIRTCEQLKEVLEKLQVVIVDSSFSESATNYPKNSASPRTAPARPRGDAN